MKWQCLLAIPAFTLLAPIFAQDPTVELERARTVNLQRSAQLPDFVADEVAIRYRTRHSTPSKWELFDKVEAEVVARDSRFQRQNVRRNGKPWKKPDLSDFNWGLNFGGLNALFGAKCPNTINFERREEFRGKALLAYRFSSLPDGCFGTFTINDNNYNPERMGRFLIDPHDGNLLFFESSATKFPKGFGADPWKNTITWDHVKIGETSYVLPVAAEVFGGFTKGDLWHVVVEYKNHRHFEASSKIISEDATVR
jgi:hypothetical protein